MSLIEKLKKAGTIKDSVILSESKMFTNKDNILTDLPILNLAFSGKLNEGFTSGITVFAGESKTFKSTLALFCIKAYLDKYKDSVILFYDTEFGTPPAYLSNFNIDISRIIHIPVLNLEEMKFDMVQRLGEVKRGDKVFVFVDSIGMVASKKEVEDAENEKSVADMSRAKQIKSLFRIVTPHATLKDIPIVFINHIYMTQEMYSKVVISGGNSVTYSANSIFVISKAEEKDKENKLSGYRFTINIHKSRTVREKSKFPMLVSFQNGIDKFSGLLDLAIESGHVVKPKMGWYAKVNLETGEIEEKNYREAQTHNEQFFSSILKDPKFAEFVHRKYSLENSHSDSSEEIDEEDQS